MDSLARGFAGIVVAAVVAQAPLVGTWALSSGKPLAAAEMRVTNESNNRVSLDIFETAGRMTTPIRKYDVDMTQRMHLIVISDDFSQFIHVHPDFNATTGHFSQTLNLDPNRRYYAYTDTDPTGLGKQVFRFILQGDGTLRTHDMQRGASALTSPAGPYAVALAKTTLKAGVPQTLDITITHHGKPATDLHTYLGAAAHAVFIDANTLDYVHVHPMVPGTMDPDMPGMAGMDMSSSVQAGPHLEMHVPALAAGTYKLWLQIANASGVYTAPFTLVAR